MSNNQYIRARKEQKTYSEPIQVLRLDGATHHHKKMGKRISDICAMHASCAVTFSC
jgi:hypothetical protein